MVGSDVGLSCSIKDLVCNGVSKWKARIDKKKRNENQKEKILNSMVVLSEKRS